MQIKNKKKPPKQGGKWVDKRRDNSGLQQNITIKRVGPSLVRCPRPATSSSQHTCVVAGLVHYQA
ncbi:MAG: hypothetical protein ACRC52_17050, partial [Aeromonas veronii]